MSHADIEQFVALAVQLSQRLATAAFATRRFILDRLDLRGTMRVDADRRHWLDVNLHLAVPGSGLCSVAVEPQNTIKPALVVVLSTSIPLDGQPPTTLADELFIEAAPMAVPMAVWATPLPVSMPASEVQS